MHGPRPVDEPRIQPPPFYGILATCNVTVIVMLIVVKRTSAEDCESILTPQEPANATPSLKTIPPAKESGLLERVERTSPVLSQPHAIAHYRHLDREYRDYFVGPVPKDFFRELLPEPNHPMPHLRPSLVGALAQSNPMGDEQLLFRPIYNQIKPYLSERFHVAIPDSPGIRLDHWEDFPQNVVFQNNKDPIVRLDLETSELHVEVKSSAFEDPFRDQSLLSTKHQFLKSGPDDPFKRGQLIAYATDACARQHRLFYYSVLICHHRARIIRWDRSGALVSESFNCSDADGMALLGDFLWRYTHAPPAARGYDPTVLAASKEEELVVARNPVMKEWYQEGSVVKLLVWDSEKERLSEFLVSRPVVSPATMIGKCTRGFWALDEETGSVVFVKDAWRVSGMEPEWAIIQKLHKHEVRNIPKLHSYGEVPDGIHGSQCTLASQYSQYYCGTTCPVARYVHYRLVSETVGHTLDSALRDSRQLLEVTQHAFEALSDAFKKCNLMHRDVSIGNIVIDRVSHKGVLIDWETACPVTDEDGVGAPFRAGTWQFMAVKQQFDVMEPINHMPIHDIESMLWVVVYATIRWFAAQRSDADVHRLIAFLFDSYRTTAFAIDAGGESKYSFIWSNDDQYRKKIDLPATSILDSWIRTFKRLFFRWTYEPLEDPLKAFEIAGGKWRDIMGDASLTPDRRVFRTPLPFQTKEAETEESEYEVEEPESEAVLAYTHIPSPIPLPLAPFVRAPERPLIRRSFSAPARYT